LSLEEQLTEVVRACLVRGEEIYRLSMADALKDAEKVVAEKLAAAEAMAEKAHADEICRYREERRRRQEALLAEANAWKQARYLREYVAACKTARGTAMPAGWAEWALSIADSLDPLIASGDTKNGVLQAAGPDTSRWALIHKTRCPLGAKNGSSEEAIVIPLS